MPRAVSTRDHRWLAATAAVLFAACLVALPAHLVHHLHRHGDKPPSCVFLALAQHTPHFTTVALEMPEPQDLGRLEPPARLTPPRSQPITASPARAPPSASLAG